MGSGTTAVSAKALGRNYIGFELSQEYCNLAESRLNDTSINRRGKIAQLTLLQYANDIKTD